MKTKRPLTLTFASLFLVLALLTGLILPLMFGARLLSGGGPESLPAAGSPASPRASGRVPGVPGSRFLGASPFAGPGMLAGVGITLLCANVAGGVVAILAAIGLWRCKRWGMILALVVVVLGIVAALPGLVGGMRALIASIPALMRIALLTGVAVLTLLPSSLDAYQ